MEKSSKHPEMPAPATETEPRHKTLSQTLVDEDEEEEDESPHSLLHSPSDKSSPSPIHSPSNHSSPLHSPSPENNTLSKSIAPVDYGYPVKPSPEPDKSKTTDEEKGREKSKSPSSVVNRAVNGEVGERKSRGRRSSGFGARRSQRWSGVGGGVGLDRPALGFRVSEMGLCLVSFSVMAADRTQGWSGDSFDRYKEYRYCLSVTVIAFAYAAFQACSLSYLLITGRHVIKHRLHHHLDFAMDQILAYLLISASSSAATRVNDWQSNWGKDEFTLMATASVTMAFLAFVSFSLSALISGYNLCNRHSS